MTKTEKACQDANEAFCAAIDKIEDAIANDDVAKKEAKALFARNRYYSPVLVRGMESEGVKVWAYGKQAYQTLLGYVLDPDYHTHTLYFK